MYHPIFEALASSEKTTTETQPVKNVDFSTIVPYTVLVAFLGMFFFSLTLL